MECKIWPTPTPSEKLERLDKEMGYIFGILKNMKRERDEARADLKLPHDDSDVVNWIEVLSIWGDLTKTEQEKFDEISSKYIILKR